ncbi:MAG: potassium-transporting ATPase subunit KdpA, partial [Giesbergeria sp.]
MSPAAWLQLAVYLALLLALAWPVSKLIAIVMDGKFALGRRIESPLFALAGVRSDAEMGWLRYALGLLAFNGLGVLAVYALQRWQAVLPLNPQGMAAVSPDSAFNTAISFVTNTNWQGYGGESTMGYLVQMLGLTVQNFLSAATGIVVVIALIRGFARHTAAGIGNVWVDLTRVTLWILLPISIVFALVFASQGVIQNLSPYTEVQTLESLQYQAPQVDTTGQPVLDAKGAAVTRPVTQTMQTLAMGPVASQLTIKMLGTNGGGFFNANSAHPFENPTAFTNLLQMLAIFVIPAALCLVFGQMVCDARQGWTILSTMTLLFVAFVVLLTTFEQQGNPVLTALGVDQASSAVQSGGNMEGKETRFGILATSLFAAVTTGASCGAVNAMHD